MFYNSSDSFEYNNCISRGACSVSPNITSMQEIMFILLRQISYYVLKLIDFEIEPDEVIYDVIFQLAFIDSMKDFSDTQLLELFYNQYSNLVKVKKEYTKLCKEKGITQENLKNQIKFTPKTNLSSILKRGDKEFALKYKKFSKDKKYYSEILSSVIKSVSTNWITLKDYGKLNTQAQNYILNSLNLFNYQRISSAKVKSYIDNLAKYDTELLKQINEYQTKNFGEIDIVSVSTSTKPNKAIMVSGSNLNDLKTLLDATKGQDIDVYTNGNLLIAHAYEFFRNYKNLKGHFGSGVFNTILDFATFPGAILLTRNETQNIEYLYRGRLFTTDKISAKGVVKIENNDFLPLINSALQAKGFAKGQNRQDEIIGFNKIKLQNELDNIIKKNPRKIFIIAPSSISVDKIEYFKSLFNLASADNYIISFSYKPNCKNSLYINIGNNYALLLNILQIIFEKIPLNSKKFVFFMTKCDVNSLSNIINLKNNGAEEIFLSECPPFVINPAVLKSFVKLYNINEITTPKNDIDKILR